MTRPYRYIGLFILYYSTVLTGQWNRGGKNIK